MVKPFSESKIAIIGLGYVGLPLAVAFAEKYKVIGIDINVKRVDELKLGTDATLEVEDTELQAALNTHFSLTTDIKDAQESSFYRNSSYPHRQAQPARRHIRKPR